MQLFTDVKQKVTDLVSENATTLLTAGGVVGTVATAVLTGRAGFKLARTIEELKVEVYEAHEGETLGTLIEVDIPKKDIVLAAAVDFLPPVITGSATIAAIILANRMSAQKAAALAAAYGLAERQLGEYKEKVAEKLTGPKKQAIEDEIAQDRVNRTKGHEGLVIVEGEVLCFDQPTGRYFRSSMENLKTAVNSTNAEILHHDYASASYFYEELGLPATTWTDDVGWNSDHLLDLTYSTVMSPDGKPCIAIDFKVLPKTDFIPKHY